MEEEDKEHCEGSSGGDKEIKLRWGLFNDDIRIFCLILCTVLRFQIYLCLNACALNI